MKLSDVVYTVLGAIGLLLMVGLILLIINEMVGIGNFFIALLFCFTAFVWVCIFTAFNK